MATADRLSVLMPVFNERATIEAAIERVLSVDVPVDHLELIVVDDGSSDGTRELLEGGGWPENVRLLSHEQNRGKGAALRTGVAEAGCEYCTVMDADLEYDPSNSGRRGTGSRNARPLPGALTPADTQFSCFEVSRVGEDPETITKGGRDALCRHISGA